MRDFKEYYKRMGANIQEKIDFVVEELDTNEYEQVIDFGCADGQTTRALAEIFPNIHFIGYDSLKEVIAVNKKNNNHSNITYMSKLEDVNLNETLVLFSSVLHEIFSFQETKISFRKELEFFKSAKAIAIRDMYFSPSNNSHTDHSFLDGRDKKVIEFFSGRRGIINKKTIAEFLLKRQYEKNWEEELKENYFSTPWEGLKYHLKSHEVIYFNIYMNSFLKEKIPELKNFTKTTHQKVIYKRLK